MKLKMKGMIMKLREMVMCHTQRGCLKDTGYDRYPCVCMYIYGGSGITGKRIIEDKDVEREKHLAN